MSLTLLIHYRQGDNILSLAKSELSPPDLKELEAFIAYNTPRSADADNLKYVDENKILKIFKLHPTLDNYYQKLLAKANTLMSNNIPSFVDLSEKAKKFFPPKIQQQISDSMASYQAAIDDYFKSGTDNHSHLSNLLISYSKMIDKAIKLNTTSFVTYQEFCSKLNSTFPAHIKNRIQAAFELSLEMYFTSDSNNLNIFDSISSDYQQMREKAEMLEIAEIKTYEKLINIIKNTLPPVVYDRILQNLNEYKEKIDQFFINPNYSLSQLKAELQPYLFLNSGQTIFAPQAFYNSALATNDITGEFLALKKNYAENYQKLINATDFNIIRATYIILIKTFELNTLNTKIDELNNELDPQKIIQHLCAANNITYPDENLQRALQPELDDYITQYETLLKRYHNEQYILEHTQIIEKLCQLHIKFNEFLSSKQNSLSNNGFYYVTEQHSPFLENIFADDLSSVINFSHNPSDKNLATLRRARHSEPNLHHYCKMFCGPDFMRMTGMGSIVFVDQHRNIIDIKKLQEELNTRDPKELGMAVLKKMHLDEPVRRLISYVAYQGAQMKMLDLLMKNIFICGYAMQWHPLYKQYIKVEGNNVIIETFIAYQPIQNNLDIPKNKLPRVFVHCQYEIPFNDEPKVQAFKIKIATTKCPDSVYRFHVTPEFIPNNKDYDFLIKYKNEFVEYLGYRLTQYERSGQSIVGINNLFNSSDIKLNEENIRLRNYIENVYQGKNTWPALAYQLINTATRKLNTSLNHSQRKRYNALLKAGTGLLIDTIPDITHLETLIKQPDNINSEKIFEIFKIFALLSTYQKALQNNLYKNTIIQLLCTFCNILKNDQNIIRRFLDEKKTDPLLSAILCGVITLAHRQKQQDQKHHMQYKELKKIGAHILFNLLDEADRNLPENPKRLIKGNFKQAVEVARYAQLAIKNTNNNLSGFNCYNLQKNLERKFVLYNKFAKDYLTPNHPTNELHNDIVKEIISADKTNWFLSTAANTKKSILSKSKLLNFLWERAKNISHGILNYFDLLKVYNLQPLAQQKKSESPANINLMSQHHAQLLREGKMEAINPSDAQQIGCPAVQKIPDAKELTDKYRCQLKKINKNTLDKYQLSLTEKERYLLNQLLNDTSIEYSYNEINNQLYTLLKLLPAKSPLKSILADVFISHFLLSPLNSHDSNSRNIYFDDFFKDPELLKPALSSLLKTEVNIDTVASEFLNYILEKIKQPVTRKHFITRSFLNKLTDKELTQLAIIDKSGEVARYILNTGFWDKWRRNHPSQKLDHVDITRIIMAHTEKDFILERAFANKSIFGGRNFSREFLPEDLASIYTYSAADLRNSTHVQNNSHLRSNLKRGIYMQKTWLEMVFNNPLMYIKDLIELSRLNDQYLTGLVKKYYETWKTFISDLTQEHGPEIIRNKILNGVVSLTATLFTHINQINNQEILIDIFSDNMKKSYYINYVLPKLNPDMLSRALIDAIRTNCVGLNNIIQLFQQNDELGQFLSPQTKDLMNTSINSHQLKNAAQTTYVPANKSPHLIDAETVRRTGLSLSSIWSSTFSDKPQPEKLSILQEITGDESARVKPIF